MPETTLPRNQKRLRKFQREPAAFAGFVLTERDLEILRLVHEFVCTNETRLAAMRRTLLKTDPQQRRRLAQFWFTLESRYDLNRPATLLAPIWQRGPRTPEDERTGTPEALKLLFGE